jgi:predicted transcriptional regulator
MMAKAVIELSDWQQMQAELRQTARRLDAGADLQEADYHLGYATAAHLLADLTPARLTLLDTLKGLGPVAVDDLAARLERPLGRVRTDVAKLLDLELISQDAAGAVSVPWDEVLIRLASVGAQAA